MQLLVVLSVSLEGVMQKWDDVVLDEYSLLEAEFVRLQKIVEEGEETYINACFEETLEGIGRFEEDAEVDNDKSHILNLFGVDVFR